MQHLYGSVMADHHLRHAGRMQLGLFLKGAGLTLEESLTFWRQSFAARTPGDKFDKEYAYNIRHSYGKEGSRKDYEPHNCRKIILGGNPGVGEAHGCPFKTLDPSALRASMSRAGVPAECAPFVTFAMCGGIVLSNGDQLSSVPIMQASEAEGCPKLKLPFRNGVAWLSHETIANRDNGSMKNCTRGECILS